MTGGVKRVLVEVLLVVLVGLGTAILITVLASRNDPRPLDPPSQTLIADLTDSVGNLEETVDDLQTHMDDLERIRHRLGSRVQELKAFIRSEGFGPPPPGSAQQPFPPEDGNSEDRDRPERRERKPRKERKPRGDRHCDLEAGGGCVVVPPLDPVT